MKQKEELTQQRNSHLEEITSVSHSVYITAILLGCNEVTTNKSINTAN